MTNNTKPIIDGKSFFDYSEKEKKEIITEAAKESSKEMQKIMSSDMSTNDKQLSDLGCGRHPIGEQCECVGYAVTEATTWEERFDKTYNKERFDEIGFVFEDFEHVKLFLKSEIATAVQEERKRIKSYLELLEPKITLSQELVNDIIEAITDKE